jgi:hypothetical protein
MKKIFLLSAIFLLAAGCGKTANKPTPVTPTSHNTQIQTEVKPLDTSAWQTFTTDPELTYSSEFKIKFTKNGFSFKHPRDWTVDLHDNPRAVLSISNPDKASGQIPSAIYFFPAQYVEFESMDDIARANHPDSAPVDIQGLSVFQYNDTTSAHNPSYHINYPDKSGGLDITLYPNLLSSSTEQYEVLDEIVKSFRFNK